LACLFLAFFLPAYLGRQSQRTANILNSFGLIALSGIIMVQALLRLSSPLPVASIVPVIAGSLAAAANFWVAQLLREAAHSNAAVRLAYLHNLVERRRPRIGC